MAIKGHYGPSLIPYELSLFMCWKINKCTECFHVFPCEKLLLFSYFYSSGSFYVGSLGQSEDKAILLEYMEMFINQHSTKSGLRVVLSLGCPMTKWHTWP